MIHDNDWVDHAEVNALDWARAKAVAERDMGRLIGEVRRMREVIKACDGAADLEHVKSIVRAERGVHGY